MSNPPPAQPTMACPLRRLSLSLPLSPSTSTVGQNCLSVEGIPEDFLVESKVSLLVIDGNAMTQAQFSHLPGHDAYSARFTAAKKKQG